MCQFGNRAGMMLAFMAPMRLWPPILMPWHTTALSSTIIMLILSAALAEVLWWLECILFIQVQSIFFRNFFRYLFYLHLIHIFFLLSQNHYWNVFPINLLRLFEILVIDFRASAWCYRSGTRSWNSSEYYNSTRISSGTRLYNSCRWQVAPWLQSLWIFAHQERFP